jgi:hypothetical protein
MRLSPSFTQGCYDPFVLLPDHDLPSFQKVLTTVIDGKVVYERE